MSKIGQTKACSSAYNPATACTAAVFAQLFKGVAHFSMIIHPFRVV